MTTKKVNGSDLLEALNARVLRLDGAMGTQIQRYGLTEDDFRQGVFADVAIPLKGNNECLNLTRPDVIAAVHEAYIAAGADIIETNTFSANRVSQKEYGLEAHAREMAFAGARIARACADKAGRIVWVAGSIGPTSKSLTLAPDINRPAERPYSFDEMAASYREQVEALLEGGVDLLLIETAFDALNVKAALYAVQQVRSGFPVIVSVSVSDRSGRTLTGQTLEAFYTAVRHYPLTAFGVNCSLGADGLLPLVKDIAAFSDVPVICYPNAGLPNELGGYDQTPAQMAAEMARMDGLLNIAGGCCGTTPDHIQALPALSPAPLKQPRKELKVSGLEAYLIDTVKRNFSLIGERTNVAGSRKFARLIAAGDYDDALSVAADQIEGGADVIDINMDDAMLDGPRSMETFVRTLQNDPAVAKAALMIDSSHWECILAGLKNAQGKCIVNSISLKDGEQRFLEKAAEIHRLGAAMVVMAFDEEGQATTYEKKIAVSERAYRLLTGIGIPPEDIIFDVNVLSIGTGIPEHDRYGIDFIEAVRWIKQNLPGAYTSGGISNLSFAFRGNNPVRSAMHAVFLYHAIRAGLDMAIVNPGMLLQYDDIEPTLRAAVEDLILCRLQDASERLMAVISSEAEKSIGLETSPRGPSGLGRSDSGTVISSEAEKSLGPETSPRGPSGLGRSDNASVISSEAEGGVEKSLEQALITGKSDKLAEAIPAALKQLGSAVAVIEGPLMAGMEEVGRRFGAGKMFLPQVVKSAKVMKDAVALLEPYMEAEEQAAQRPVVIHATVKGDVHDIGKNIAGIVLRCNGFEVIDLGVMVDKETILEAAEKHHAALIGVSGLITPSLFQMEELCREMKARGLDTPLLIGGATTSALHTAVKLAPLYDHVFYAPDASAGAVLAKKCLRDRAAFEADQHAEQARIRALHEGRKAAPAASTTAFAPDTYIRSIPEDIPLTELPLEELVPLFDWSMFRAVWGVRESAELTAEGKAVLGRMVRDRSVSVRLAARFFAARRDGDAIDLGGFRLPMLRQEEAPGRSLADFVPADGTGPFGLFAISVHGRHPQGCTCEACSNEYDSMMERAVRVTLAEAASTWLDKRLSEGLPKGVRIAKPAAGYAACPDHSLKRDILSLLPEGLDITLTESCAMRPDATICGFIVLHPEAGYPEIRHIGPKQYELYTQARGFSPDEAKAFLSHLL